MKYNSQWTLRLCWNHFKGDARLLPFLVHLATGDLVPNPQNVRPFAHSTLFQ